jgi:transcriptional regulator with XRE-family HTH domain
MSHQKSPRTPAGMRLRALREACGKTQLDVELDASLGIGYLQRLELGKIGQPERDTLERILAAVSASYMQRREVLELFGYRVAITVPNENETRWAIDAFQGEVKQDAIPAYLLDCAHRLLAWNSLIPKVFSEFQTKLTNTLIPRLIFDPIDGFAAGVVNADVFFATQIRILQYEGQRHGGAAGYGAFVEGLRAYPLFDKYWREQSLDLQVHAAFRPVADLKLDTGRGLAHFRLISEVFAQDARFRVIYDVPVDRGTVRRCSAWG